MDFENFFLERRTIRNYSDREVGDELINELIEEAMHAPNTGNMQTYSVVVTRNEEMKRRLAPLHFDQPCSINCSVLLTFCVDFHRFTRWCEISKANPGYDNFHSFVSAVIDTSLFAQQFNTAAELRGLGCCYLGTTTYNAQKIAEVLQLPSLVVPVTTIAVGWPSDEGVDSGRLPLRAIVHKETYKDPTDEQLKDLYAETEARLDSKKFVAENGKETLAQVFTDIRYTKEANELISRMFFDFVKKAGFYIPE